MVYKHEALNQSKFYEFTQFIAGFASAFIALNLYYDVAAREETSRKELADKNVTVVRDLWLEPNNKLALNYDRLGNMPAEMFPQLNIKDQTSMEQVNMALEIFQTFENYGIIYEQNPRELSLWLRHYLQWAQSQTLQDLWPKLMHNYKPGTVKFVNFLFKHANGLKRGTGMSSAYINMANQIRDEARSILMDQN
jgi:hypothetical protein